ncbi:MAG: amidase [Fimbriimonas ginsengisoli]|uniref:Amidase n=1 Tax=Fimbriimonas ginsengisoli TaxID=1005039 RepID=A0A931PUK8_FIMGI|nr:amidase [Fimbriimonas ginsengisoli]
MSRDLLSRKDLLRSSILSVAALTLPGKALARVAPDEIGLDDLKAFTKIAGLSFAEGELKEILPDVKDWLTGYPDIRAMALGDELEPPTVFIPKSHRKLSGRRGVSVRTVPARSAYRPSKDEDLAYLSVRELASLIKSKKVSPVELTELYLERLERYGDPLLCVVTLMREQALEMARAAEREIQDGRYRGPLHGIPCGIKDLFAMKGAPTTWGAEPYKNQILKYDSAVVERLHQAGAIILAKLSMGALAQGDVWFRGVTKNPWNLKEGSSGSSAGPACATAAGLVAFAVGTETLGSIMSPSHRCRVTGLRPTYGRGSRHGAMGLSYTMDKVGPICREAEDCALVFAALAGHDPRDRSSVDAPFHYRHDVKLSELKVGIVEPADKEPKTPLIRETLEKLGVQVRDVKLAAISAAMLVVLEVEAAAAFDDFTRSERIRSLKNSAWPNSFRASRFVPGVEYLRAQRARAWLMDKFEEDFGDLDALALSGIGRPALRIANLTGHPQVLIPQGADAKGQQLSVSFVGRIYEEADLLALASAYQRTGGYHRLRPQLT